MKTWLLCDDYYHPGEIPQQGLQALSEIGIQFDVTPDARDFSFARLAEYPVVVLAKGDSVSARIREPWETPEVEEAFVNYVEAGGGLLVIHSGTTGKTGADRLHALMGCRFISHPEQCPVTVTPLKQHPITEGVQPFTQQDEHYFIDLYARDADILAVSSSVHGVTVSGYVRTQGKGRVCVLTPGHNLAVWQDMEYRKMLCNALRFCAGTQA